MSTSYQRILGYGFGRLVLVYRLSLSPPEVVVIRELEDLAYPTRNSLGDRNRDVFLTIRGLLSVACGMGSVGNYGGLK